MIVKINKWKALLIAVFVVIVVLVVLLFSPPRPIWPKGIKQIVDYESSIKAIQIKQEQNIDILNPDCVSKLMTHDKKVKGVVLMFHGYTSCPQQFAALGKKFFEAGYNVYIPRTPYHGYKNLLTDDVGKLTTVEYVNYAEQSLAEARGLGEEVVVMGLSGGGNLAIWLAQHLEGIDKAIIIAPGLGSYDIPEWATPPLVNIYPYLPTQFRWWNDQDRGKSGLSYEYPRFSVNVLMRTLAVGRSVLQESVKEPPRAGKIVFVYNASDKSILEPPVKLLEQRWKAKIGERVSDYTFPAEMNLQHPFINSNSDERYRTEIFDKLVELVR